jgi:hypothetical protein
MRRDKQCRNANGVTVVHLRRIIAGVGLICAGAILGSVTFPPSQAQGEVRATPPPEAFKTGGQLSLPILSDIAATLRQMDARLARLETSAKQAQTDVATLATIAKQAQRSALEPSQ